MKYKNINKSTLSEYYSGTSDGSGIVFGYDQSREITRIFNSGDFKELEERDLDRYLWYIIVDTKER